MLSRTAEHLFWMARSIERAENLARLLDSTWLMSLVPQARETRDDNWAAVIALHSLEDAFHARYREANAENVLRFMIGDDANPASIHGCLRNCRENAHAVRGTITPEMWETINATWLQAREMRFDDIVQMGYSDYFDWVKLRSALTRGVTLGTLLQDECYHFIRLGTLLERADSTARILDMKYHGTAARTSDDEPYRFDALVRAVSAVEAYRRLWRDALTPERVLELLIHRPEMPRSLHFCLAGVLRNLQAVANPQSSDVLLAAGKLLAQVQYTRVSEIMAQGVHPWLDGVIDAIYALGEGISRDVLNPMPQR